MKLYLGGHLNFYHPHSDSWLEVDVRQPTALTKILDQAGIPLGEVHLVIVNQVAVELEKALICAADEVKIFSAVGGG